MRSRDLNRAIPRSTVVEKELDLVLIRGDLNNARDFQARKAQLDHLHGGGERLGGRRGLDTGKSSEAFGFGVLANGGSRPSHPSRQRQAGHQQTSDKKID